MVSLDDKKTDSKPGHNIHDLGTSEYIGCLEDESDSEEEPLAPPKAPTLRPMRQP